MELEIAATSPYVPALFGLAGSLIGGLVAGGVSLRVTQQAREAAEQAWMRDSRRDIYDRFLTSAQQLLDACANRWRLGSEADSIETAHRATVEAYGVIQTVADEPLVHAARVYARRLLELEAELDGTGKLGSDNFDIVAGLVRLARHATIDKMRKELQLAATTWPDDRTFNPFLGTPLEKAYREALSAADGSAQPQA